MKASAPLFSLAFASLALLAALETGCAGKKDKGDDDDDDGTLELLTVEPVSAVPGTEIVLSGLFFGADTGTVSFGAAAATNTVSWLDDEVRVILPAAALPGSTTVTITSATSATDSSAFEVRLPRVVYSNDQDAASLFAWSITPAGALTPLAGSPYDTGEAANSFGGDPDALAVHEPTRRLFSSAAGSLSVWNLDPQTGVPVHAPNSPILVNGSADFYGIAVSPDGQQLFAASATSNSVFGFDVAADGTLTPAVGFPVTGNGLSTPWGPKVARGHYLYVIDDDGPFGISAWDVGVSPPVVVPGSPFDALGFGLGLTVSPDGTRLYRANLLDYIEVWNVSVAGIAVEDTSLRFTIPDPSSMSFAEGGERLFAHINNDNNLFALDVDPTTGEMTLASGPLTIGTNAEIGTISADGRLFAWGEAGFSGFTIYSIDSQGAPSASPVGSSLIAPGSSKGIEFTGF